jgi:hypothetical protein
MLPLKIYPLGGGLCTLQKFLSLVEELPEGDQDMAILKLEPFENTIEDIGLLTCTVTASVPPMFRIRGVVLDRRALTPSQVVAKPATTLVLPMRPETAIELAVAILQAAQSANIELPAEVSLRS